MNSAMQRAGTVAGSVYQRFLQYVLEDYVLKERSGPPLGEKQKQACKEGKEIDPRTLYLMSISGKGGWDDDPVKWERYRHNQNITLLDHLLSVVRGAMLLAALDWLLDNPEMDEIELRQRLIVIATIGFLHDLDKILGLPRDEVLTLEHVRIAVERYGITPFLDTVKLSDEQIRFLIEQAEDSQRYRNPAVIPPPRGWKQAVERYVKLADKLDGLWQQHGANGGLEAIIQRLQQDQSLASPLLAQWEAIDIFDPHHPFLLDELQRRLSHACQRLAGIPPLLETHQDGRLFVLLPKEQAENIKNKALKGLINQLPFNLEMRSPNAGTPAVHELRNDSPTHEKLISFLEEQSRSDLTQLFRVKISLKQTLTPYLDVYLGDMGLAPQWPKNTNGATTILYADPEIFTGISERRFLQATHLVLLLNLALPISKENGLPTPEKREELLLQEAHLDMPDWLQEVSDSNSRRVLLGLWILSVAHKDDDLLTKIWGKDGLLKKWLEGCEEVAGFNKSFEGQEDSEIIKSEVIRHFIQVLNKERVHPESEKNSGRCLFTDEPTPTIVKDHPGVYEINVSAFSGREGKPDSINSPAYGIVPISYVSVAEHKLRSEAYRIQTGTVYKKQPTGGPGVPVLISSPMTTGLFSALTLNNDQQLSGYSLFDLARQKIEKGKLHYVGLEVYRHRYRLAKMEKIPESLPDRKANGKVIPGQISILRQLLTAAIRIGRPIHVFKGLPTPQKAFFYFDAMPSVLKQLLGDQELRLEQIPAAIQRLNMAQTLASTPGLGYDVLGLYAMQHTRFQTVCLAWCHAHEATKPDKPLNLSMKQLKDRLYTDFYQLMEQKKMSESDGALVRLGQAAARIQSRQFTSNNDEILVFNLCLRSALDLRGAGQTDSASLIYGIAGELETNLVRKGKAAARKHRDDQPLDAACIDFARQFVTEVWHGVLHGKPPAQKTRRLLGSVYRMAFLQSFRDARSSTDDETPIT